MNVTKYTPTAPALAELKETYIYRIFDKLTHRQRPTATESRYILELMNRQQVAPGKVLLRGWLFDFSLLTKQPDTAQLSLF